MDPKQIKSSNQCKQAMQASKQAMQASNASKQCKQCKQCKQAMQASKQASNASNASKQATQASKQASKQRKQCKQAIQACKMQLRIVLNDRGPMDTRQNAQNKAASILHEMELLRSSRIGLAPKLQWLGHHLPGNTDAAANYAKQQPKLLHIQ